MDEKLPYSPLFPRSIYRGTSFKRSFRESFADSLVMRIFEVMPQSHNNTFAVDDNKNLFRAFGSYVEKP
jgi:hypothetical protein